MYPIESDGYLASAFCLIFCDGNPCFGVRGENGFSISVAANSVGYTDICNFSKMFKRHFKMSPREYIRLHKKEI